MRAHKWVFVVVFFLLAVIGVVTWGAKFIGMSSYKLMENKISQLDSQEKEVADEEFYGQGKDDNIYTGTISKINTRGDGGLWIQTKDGLKYFHSDKYTVYSYYDVCQAYRNQGHSEPLPHSHYSC